MLFQNQNTNGNKKWEVLYEWNSEESHLIGSETGKQDSYFWIIGMELLTIDIINTGTLGILTKYIVILKEGLQFRGLREVGKRIECIE